MIGYGTSRMKKLPIVFVLISSLVYSYVQQADTLTGNIVRIIDGDTVVVVDSNKVQYKIRLMGRCA